MSPSPADKILEVGVANIEYSPVDNFLVNHYPYKRMITALGVGSLQDFKYKYPDVQVVSYDGKFFPFKDKEFDIAHANAVIEHVGSIEDQKRFLKEMIRVAKRGMITTPNKYFPVETHTCIPLLHLISKELFEKFLNVVGKKWATGRYMHLLGLKNIEFLLRNVKVRKYHIIKNRFLGFTMTFSILWWD
ncbi:MAG: class I SAM-dependent methyltransferase [Endomicrobia bacterium]|nr:class I SAM-dependent methyltransferase [Endomicrobiia bacterium]